MNGVHDMGGMDGFGAVEPEADEPMFHAAWEGRVLTMVRALGSVGAFNLDASRFYREKLPPAKYLSSSYYENWLAGLEDLLIDLRFVSVAELEAGHASGTPKPLPDGGFTIDRLDRLMVRGKFDRPAPVAALFTVGQRVRARNIHPTNHTRLPRYVRGHEGVIERIHGCHVYPDSKAHGHGDNPQWLYTVVFDGTQLWGSDSDPKLKVSIEAFEPYLEMV